MPKPELNLKSSTIEKGLEIVKDLLEKLVSPSAEEFGLLMSENIKFYRFKKQLKILIKTQDLIKKHNISVSNVPLKILVPLLDSSSLEDNEEMENKWAKMLANMANSNKNLQNQVFPYILSQISLEEFDGLKKLKKDEDDFNIKLKEFSKLKESKKPIYFPDSEIKKIQNEINKTNREGFNINLEEFEISNLIRLGIIKQLPPDIWIPEFKTGKSELMFGNNEEWHQIDAEYTDDNWFRITELGIRLIEVCELEKE